MLDYAFLMMKGQSKWSKCCRILPAQPFYILSNSVTELTEQMKSYTETMNEFIYREFIVRQCIAQLQVLLQQSTYLVPIG